MTEKIIEKNSKEITQLIIDNHIFNNFQKQQEQIQKQKIVLIMMNYYMHPYIFFNCLALSDITMACDGGANRIYNLFEKYNKNQIIDFLEQKSDIDKVMQKLQPDYIIGDLDSAKENILIHYEQLGSKIIKDPNQDNTDLGKSIQYFKKQILQNDVKNYRFILLGGLGGRLDHTIQNISTLQQLTMEFKEEYQNQNFLFQLMDEFSIATCLPPGQQNVYKRSVDLESKLGVGIFTLQKKDMQLRTYGLKWDIDQEIAEQLEFGKFLSSSNEFLKDQLYVDNNLPVILTTTLKEEKYQV
ncbi:Thiamin pyrophosphokinase, vitamin B1-binding domain [Pseudocohnilembus persalinus]|uniref:Thiamin pyrophosphokinase, vitamin B1-binding domain n=1 Tax=Pseudocohnilembus persalinus TaxID=266149 RepID=A0A0V0QGR6_PSEPJ|nr:Thiamin pyrophosphokinase, vitamin B1-binding domain [Pseudocohnilembus persalinus]|eukprot:KRX01285.1 Thiamin pyrophosphokinase, vitamin B1-binding domain [Pseudocohnilembus persalinus]